MPEECLVCGEQMQNCKCKIGDAYKKVHTLTSELEAERKAKEEAIECIRLAYENDLSWEARAVMMDNKCMERAKDRLGKFLKTHTVSKGEK